MAVKKEGAGTALGNGQPAPASAAAAKAKRERKEYEILGQTKDTPEEGDPCRIFYESLLREKPESLLAKQWLLERGLISSSSIDKVFSDVMKHKGKSTQDIERLKSAKGVSGVKKKTPVKREKQTSSNGVRVSLPSPKSKTPPASSPKALSRKSSSTASQVKRKPTPQARKPFFDDDDDDDDDYEVMPTKKVRKFI